VLGDPTQIQQFFMMFGPFLIVLLCFLGVEIWRGQEEMNWSLARNVLIFGLVAYRLFEGTVAGWFELGLARHGESVGQTAQPAAIWAVRLGLLAAGAAAGWLASPAVNAVLGRFFAGFNRFFDMLTGGYGRVVRRLLRASAIVLLMYAGLIGLTYWSFRAVPKGFIPEQDKGYLVVNAQLPDGASLERTDAVVRQMSQIARKTPGVAHTIEVPGYSLLLSTNLSNVGGMFVILDPFEERKDDPERSLKAIAAKLRAAYRDILAAQIAVFGAPPIDGLGTTGGFKLHVQDRRGAGYRALQGATQNLADVGNRDPRLAGLFTSFSVRQPQLFLEIDRDKAKAQGVSLNDVNLSLQAYLGGYYVNDITLLNRNWQVNVQADAPFRVREEDIGRLEVRNAQGKIVPLRTLLAVKNDSGPAVVNHYSLMPSAEINGGVAPGTSSREAIAIMDRLASENLPSTMDIAWTDLSFQQLLAEKDQLAKWIFPLCVLFVFMVLAAQYESWSLPVAIVLIVPMCILAALTGVWFVGLDNNIFTQIGLVVLIGLAAKNAILIVEFAKERQAQGLDRIEAAIEACKMRLRPILMTSLAFILGVLPLVLAKGAGAEMRVALGVAVFSGMLGVTLFGLFFTPVFYATIRRLARNKPPAPAE
jgi:multidrug efflux pump